MAKALKVAAIVAGVAAIAASGGAALGLIGAGGTLFGLGVSAATLALVSGGLSAASSLLSGGKKVPVTATQTDRLYANIDPRAFRKTPLGKTALPFAVTDA